MADCDHDSITVLKTEPVSGHEADLTIECVRCNATIVERYDLTELVGEANEIPDPNAGWKQP